MLIYHGGTESVANKILEQGVLLVKENVGRTKRKRGTNKQEARVIPKLTIQVTKTANGEQDYVQIMSGDMFTVNVVLIAQEIEVNDKREPKKT